MTIKVKNRIVMISIKRISIQMETMFMACFIFLSKGTFSQSNTRSVPKTKDRLSSLNFVNIGQYYLASAQIFLHFQKTNPIASPAVPLLYYIKFIGPFVTSKILCRSSFGCCMISSGVPDSAMSLAKNRTLSASCATKTYHGWPVPWFVLICWIGHGVPTV